MSIGCSDPLRGFITDPRTMTRVLSHLGVPVTSPPLSTARPPPQAPGLWVE